MSEYRRFFSYIYAYEHDQKTSNTGFAKIETKGATTTIELHMHGAVLSAPAACLYLFVRNDDLILGFSLGDVPFSGGNADRRFTLNQPTLGESSYTIADVAGILLTANEKICFVSQWDEAPIIWQNFRTYEPERSPVPEPAGMITAPSVTDPSVADSSMTDSFMTDSSMEEKVIQSAELPQAQRQILVQKSTWQETWQMLTSTLPLIQPFSNPTIRCVRVELKDLRLLPPSNWHLVNNSFLLHAFFTYRHLIFGEIPSAKDRKWFIGVPGIRYRQEHVLAAIFGFADFLPDKESNDTDAPFGYWYVAMTEED